MKNVELYEFVQKLAKKKKKKEKKESWDFNPGPIWLAIVDILSLIVVLLTSATGRCGLIRPPGRKLRPLSYPPHIEKRIKNPFEKRRRHTIPRPFWSNPHCPTFDCHVVHDCDREDRSI